MNRIIKKYQNFTPFREVRGRLKVSEREFVESAGVSRACYRQIESGTGNPTVESLAAVAAGLSSRISVLAVPEGSPLHTSLGDLSTVGVSYRVIRDRFDSWKVHFMDLVDAFRRTVDPRLLLLPPSRDLPVRLKALLASIVAELCHEAWIDIPDWAARDHFLSEPWFPSEMESLKASALLESPWSFRRNNIFVQENILRRA